MQTAQLCQNRRLVRSMNKGWTDVRKWLFGFYDEHASMQ
jgi:hypothetical protein